MKAYAERSLALLHSPFVIQKRGSPLWNKFYNFLNDSYQHHQQEPLIMLENLKFAREMIHEGEVIKGKNSTTSFRDSVIEENLTNAFKTVYFSEKDYKAYQVL